MEIREGNPGLSWKLSVSLGAPLNPSIMILTALVMMVVGTVSCMQPNAAPTSTTVPVPSPLWTEGEAIAVVKERCAEGVSTAFGVQMSKCQRETSGLRDLEWTARYDSRARRWDVRVSGLETFGRDKRVHPIRAYVYENTKTVEWVTSGR